MLLCMFIFIQERNKLKFNLKLAKVTVQNKGQVYLFFIGHWFGSCCLKSIGLTCFLVFSKSIINICSIWCTHLIIVRQSYKQSMMNVSKLMYMFTNIIDRHSKDKKLIQTPPIIFIVKVTIGRLIFLFKFYMGS